MQKQQNIKTTINMRDIVIIQHKFLLQNGITFDNDTQKLKS